MIDACHTKLIKVFHFDHVTVVILCHTISVLTQPFKVTDSIFGLKMNITRALKFNCYILKFLGLLPLSIIKNKNSLKISHSWCNSLFVLIIVVLYDIFHITTILTRNVMEVKDILTVILNTYSQYAGVSVLTFIILLRVIKQKSIIKFLRILMQFDKQFYRLTFREINNRSWFRNFLSSIILGICVIGYTEWSNCLMFVNDGPAIDNAHLCLIMCYIPIIVVFIAELQYLSYLSLVKMRYKAIKDQIGTLEAGNWNIALIIKNKTRVNETMKLEKLVELYQNLNDAMKLINSTFSLQNLVVLLFQFVTLVLLAYNFCIDFTRWVFIGKSE